MSTGISIIMPAYNSAAFIGEALASVSRQTFADFECLVLDGGSTDATCDIVCGHASRDKRIRLCRHKGASFVERLNIGIRDASGPLLARLDSDDLAMPGRLAAQHAAFAQAPGLVLLGSAIEVINAEGTRLRIARYPVEPIRLREALLETCPFAHSSVMFRRSAALAAGGYREAFSGAEDHDLWLRLSRQGEIGNLEVPLVKRRLHATSMSMDAPLRQAIASAWAVEDHAASVRPMPSGTVLAKVLVFPQSTEQACGQLEPFERGRFLLNLHRSLFFGESMPVAEIRETLRGFITHWLAEGPADSRLQRRFRQILMRGAVQAWRARQFEFAFFICRSLIVSAWKNATRSRGPAN